jgi:hypothetical protein
MGMKSNPGVLPAWKDHLQWTDSQNNLLVAVAILSKTNTIMEHTACLLSVLGF